MELQGNQNSQNNIEKEEQSWTIPTSQFESLPQNYANQDSVVLT